MKYVKKPIVVEAFQWTFDEVPEWWAARKDTLIEVHTATALIPTLEGLMRASPGDYIIQGVKGEIYPCKPDIFLQTYDPKPDGNVHCMPTESPRPHVEDKSCWCHPELTQAIDETYGYEVWLHRGYEDINQ